MGALFGLGGLLLLLGFVVGLLLRLGGLLLFSGKVNTFSMGQLVRGLAIPYLLFLLE